MEKIIRWTIRRKAALLHQIETGAIKEEDACHEYKISRYEIDSWRTHLSKFGLKGLRTTCYLDYKRGTTPINGY